MTGQPDETGLLASLGLQSFFSGNSLKDLSVNPDLQASPAQLAASRTGGYSDGQQLDRIIALRSEPVFSNSGESIEERLASITGQSGSLVSSKQQELGQRDVRQQQLESSRDELSGVDPNEELLQMLQYQRAFQAASRFVTSIDNTLNELLNLVKA
jgi:flagellar hook-associated protein FlgK